MIVGIVLAQASEFAYAWQSWLQISALATALFGLSWFYSNVRKGDDGRLGEMLHETTILVAYGPPAAALSYIVLSPALPLADAHFAAMDLWLGLDWPSWYRTVASVPALQSSLNTLYHTSLPHIGIVLIATGLIGRTDRTRELNTLLIATSLPMVLISGLVPALSAWVYHDLGVDKAYHLAHVMGLRDGSFRLLEVGNLLGIITFPSFHTAIALVLIWVSRGIAWLFWPTTLIGIGVLISIPSEGGHYFVDVLAGSMITVAAILTMQRYYRRSVEPLNRARVAIQ